MASLLHQQLKEHYVSNTDRHEVTIGRYRIDAVDRQGRLIEIQCASLSAIRDKIRDLVSGHRVIVVKPLAARRKISTRDRRGGEIVRSRYSPVRQSLAHLFIELVHFGIFPHPNLRLDVLLTEQEEIRIPPSRRSSRRKTYAVEERTLLTVTHQVKLRTARDLWTALAPDVPQPFTTMDLTSCDQMPRWLAQKAAWCFRQMNFIEACGKQGHAVQYRLKTPARSRRRAAA